MDNLRLEHPPGTFSTTGSHLLPFTSPSIEFSPSIVNAQQNAIPFSASWASLLTEAHFPQNPSGLSKHGMPNPDRAIPIRSWDGAADTILHQKHAHPLEISSEFPLCAGSSLEVLKGESSSLQSKHENALVVAGFGHLSTSVDAMRGDTCTLLGESVGNYSRKDDLHLPGLLVALNQGDASPLSAVSGVQPGGFACKLDPFTGRNQRFASFAWHERDNSERCFKENSIIVKNEVVGEDSMGLIEGFIGGHKRKDSACDAYEMIVKKEQDAGVTIASLEDGSIGLRLGKRTYYGDGGAGEEGRRRVNSSNICCNGSASKNLYSKNSSNASCATTTTTANTITVATTATNSTIKNNSAERVSSKKQKGSSVSAFVPMCQAEGCTADLSGAKDYHRRHKVCDRHSKASKAKVNNLEQRFCQQCSRFHILSAFDEGKRSCRRRLAGHNERRRKPPPEPLPFLSPGGFTIFADGRANAALQEHPYFLQHRRPSLSPSSIDNTVLACQFGLAGFPHQETMGNYHALELHRYMQGLPPGRSGIGLLDGGGTFTLANGNALALSTAPSLPAPASSSTVGLLPHVSSEMAISGRALSLLSPSLGSPETMSISLGITTPSIDQILSGAHSLTASRQQVVPKSNCCFSSGIGMPAAMFGLPQSHNHVINSLTSSSSGCSTEIDQGEPPMSNFEGRSLFLINSENSYRTMDDGGTSQHGRPVLNLMQISPEESNHHHQQPQLDLPYVDLPGLSILNRQNII